MSNYVRERAERVLSILEEEDGKVVREYIKTREAEALEAQRRRYEGPPWFWWVIGALLLGLPIAAGTHAVVGCEHDARVKQGAANERALTECREIIVQKDEALKAIAKACGGEQ